jgi:hypothetical protein
MAIVGLRSQLETNALFWKRSILEEMRRNDSATPTLRWSDRSRGGDLGISGME